jgi:hypothetical protein
MSAEPTMAAPEYEQLLENLRQLGLSSVAPVLDVHLKRAAQHTMSYQDFLAGVVREALSVRDQRRRERRLAACHFPFVKRLPDFEWEAQLELGNRPLLARCQRQAQLIAGKGRNRAHIGSAPARPAIARSAPLRLPPRPESAFSAIPARRSRSASLTGLCQTSSSDSRPRSQ